MLRTFTFKTIQIYFLFNIYDDAFVFFKKNFGKNINKMNTSEYKEIIKRIASNDEALLKNVNNFSRSKLIDISNSISALMETKRFSSNNFVYTANNSLSGGVFPCSAFDCRVEKINELSSFASLYADHVYLFDPFEEIHLFEDSRMILEFIYAVKITNYLIPLIEANIVSFSKKELNICNHCLEDLYSSNVHDINKNSEALDALIKEEFLNNCTTTLIKNEDSTFSIRILGPEPLISHGQIYYQLHERLDNFKKYTKYQLPYKFSRKELIDLEIYENTIQSIAYEASYLEKHSKLYPSAILSDNEKQVTSFMQTNSNDFNPGAFHDGLKHNLPAVFDKNLNEILKIRSNEGEAFNVYRDSLQKLVKDTVGWNPDKIHEIFNDTIRPEINKINKTVRDWKETKKKNLRDKVFVGTALVSAGIITGTLPLVVSNAFTTFGAAAGGATAAGSCLNDILSLKSDIPARANSNYFLWKIIK